MILLVAIAYLLLYQIDTTDESRDPMLDEVLTKAYTSIQEARTYGADVSTLVERFNQAVNYSEQARNGFFESCNSKEDCLNKSYVMLNSIITEAESIAGQAVKDKLHNDTLLFLVYSPIIALCSSIVIYLLANHPRRSVTKYDSILVKVET